MVIHGRYNASQLIYVETFFVLGSEFIVIKSISVMRGEVGNYTCIPYFRYINLKYNTTYTNNIIFGIF